MKNYKEIADSVFDRRDKYEIKKKNKKMFLLRILTPVCCLCLVVAVAAGILQVDRFLNNITISNENGEGQENIQSSTDGIGKDNQSTEDDINSPNNIDINEDSIIWGDAGKSESLGSSFVKVGNKNTSVKLLDAMNKSNESAVFAVSISGEMDSFIYNGKTIKEYRLIAEDEQLYRKKLVLLLEEGHELKYGELLYTTGTPSGKKWTKEVYDERMEFYGEEMIAKYIINGEFFSDDVITAIEEYDDGKYVLENMKLYNEAVAAYSSQFFSELLEILENKQVKYELSTSNPEITIFLTASQFRTLEFEGIEYYVFKFATKDGISTETN